MKPLFLFAVILIQILSVGNAQGCSCIIGSVRQNIKRSEVVMTGIITSEKQMTLLDSTLSEEYPSVSSVLEYKFALETAYKGGISRDTVTIYSSETSAVSSTESWVTVESFSASLRWKTFVSLD